MARPPLKILLVDDNSADVLLTQCSFEDGDEVVHLQVVRDGLEALAFLKREGEFAAAPRPDLVLLDVNMPRMNGVEFLTHVRADAAFSDLCVVVMTASVGEVERWRAKDIGASAYVTKPVEPRQVLAALTPE